jgi:hypothetical protein
MTGLIEMECRAVNYFEIGSTVPLVRRAFAGRRGVGCDDVYEES